MGDAFSDWFINSPPKVCDTNPALVSLCRGVVLLWSKSGDDVWMQRQQEMKKLKHYLDYLRSLVLWERSRVVVAEGLEARREQYVVEQVLEFENEEKMKKEEAE
jgi:hypothetical protein